MLKTAGQWLLATAISLVCVEIMLQAAVRLGFADLDLPSYSLKEADPFWQDINPDFGVWHPANARFRHERSCFDLIYTSNAFGMRDREATLAASSPRVVVLGDSFVEGWGVAEGQRLTDRLEALTGIRHLDFGTAGEFGSTQAYLLYTTLAAKFAHSAVIFMILPENDFLDDLPSPARLKAGARHRPYLVGTYPDYRLAYPPGAWSPDKQLSWHVKNLLREFWLTARAADHAVTLAQQMIAYWRKKGSFDPLHSYYFDYKPDEFDRLRYAIERIKAAAGDRPMLIATIPVEMDYRRAEATGMRPPLTRALEDLSARLGITYIDLLDRMHEPDRGRYYLKCDPHWSSFGHARAAAALKAWSFYRGE